MSVASVQFDTNDPKIQRQLLKIAAEFASGGAGRIGMGTGGKFIIEAVLNDPAILALVMSRLGQINSPQSEADVAVGGKRKKG